jgi:hypothetical protein
MLCNKCMKSKPIGEIQRKHGDSQFWSGFMKIKDHFLTLGSFHLNNGENTGFSDKWIRNIPLIEQYPSLFRIVRHKHKIVASAFSTIPLNISFRKSLLGENLVSWHNLVARIGHVTLNERSYVFRWGLNQNGIFSVRTMYNAMITGNICDNYILWKLKLSLMKINFFLWYLKKGAILTKDNLSK